MLKRVRIKNFRKHKDLELNFTPGLNCITGMSDQGKSAIIGALRWCWKNKPDGFGFKTWKTKKSDPTYVISEFDNCTIHKERNDSEHFYKINGREDKYEAMRGNVPEEVINLVNIASYCFKTQHEPFFLLWDSPGEVSKKLNEAAGLTIVDDILNLSKSKEKEAIKEVEKLGKDIEEIEKELGQLFYIVAARKMIENLSGLQDDNERLDKLISQVESLVSDIQKIDSEMNKINNIVKLERRINKITEELENIIDIENDIESLTQLILQVNLGDEQMNQFEKLLMQEVRIENLLDYCLAIEECKKNIDEIASCISSCIKYEKEIKECGEKVLMLELEYEKKLKELGICPMCMKEIE